MSQYPPPDQPPSGTPSGAPSQGPAPGASQPPGAAPSSPPQGAYPQSAYPPQYPPYSPTGYYAPTYYAKEHRGTLILVFSILSWFVCVIFGIVAWVMANEDLRQMDAGVMDPTGRDTTKAGKIVAMISVILSLAGIGVAAIFILFILIAGGAAAFLA